MSDKGVLQFSSIPRSRGAAPLPAQAILVPSWQRARDLSCSAVLAGEMCVVVTGLPGTGKTVLVDTVARALRSTGWTVKTYAARLPSEEEFGALKGSAAILIDDADRLSAMELRTLNRLRHCSVLLAGALGLERRCAADSRVTLSPLPVEEVELFVAAWLEQLDLSPALIADAAVLHLAEISAGIPRVLRTLLAEALKAARADGSDQIEPHHIDNAAWHHVEHTAARRLKRATLTAKPAPDPQIAKPAATPSADFEARLSQAPFAQPLTAELPPSRPALQFAGVSMAVVLAAAAGALTSSHWRLLTDGTSSVIAALRPSPPPAPPAVVAARPQSIAEPLTPAEIVSAPPAQVDPPAPASTVPAELAPAPSPPLMTALSEPAPPPRPATPEPLSPDMITLLNQRGQQMIALNDLSAARLLFTRAAESGSVKAMVYLGRSYDPAITSRADTDPAQAAEWYLKAAALGSTDAVIFLQQLAQAARE